MESTIFDVIERFRTSTEQQYRQKDYYEYKGFPLTKTECPPLRLAAVEVYDNFRPDDIFVYTFPKAGTHLSTDIVKAVIMESQGLSCKENMNDKKFGFNMLEFAPSTSQGEVSLVRCVLYHPDDPLAALEAKGSPRILASYLPLNLLPPYIRQGKLKIIRMIRNVKDVMCSAYNYRRSVNHNLDGSCSFEEFVSLFMQGKLVYGGDYFNWLHGIEHLSSTGCMLTLQYETVIEDLRTAVLQVTQFLDIHLCDEQINRIVEVNTFVNRKQNADAAASVYLNKGESGAWKKMFTPALNEKVDAWISERSAERSINACSGTQ